ncbi:MAG TPA: hypothetical protein VMT63_13615 [Bacteroidales bacterium]|nr:hypothetical protein [Bacteroidales bacterium]
MKYLDNILLIVCIGFCSCNNPNTQNKIAINNLPDTAGYFAARNMKGLASFKLGMTTYKQALSIIKDEIRKDSKRSEETGFKEMPKYHGYDPKYMDFTFDKDGNIASSFYREDFGFIIKEIKFDTTKNNFKGGLLEDDNFGCPKTKAINVFQYYIGDIELMKFELKFYQDTLYHISCSQNDGIESGFKVKYGNGIYYEHNEYKTPFGITNKRPENAAILKKTDVLKIDERYIWENESVKAISQKYYDYKNGGSMDCFFTMDMKNTRLDKEIRDCQEKATNAWQRLSNQKKEQEINKL